MIQNDDIKATRQSNDMVADKPFFVPVQRPQNRVNAQRNRFTGTDMHIPFGGIYTLIIHFNSSVIAGFTGDDDTGITTVTAVFGLHDAQ